MIKKFQNEQFSLNAVAQKLWLDWRTVKKYVNNQWNPKYNRIEPYNSKVDEYKDYIISRLERYPWLTAEKIFREVKEKWFSGWYRIVADYVSKIKKGQWITKAKSFIRIETPPWKEIQVDWGNFWLIKFKNWEIFKVKLFAWILSFSRNKYAEFTRDEQLITLMKCHDNMFNYFWWTSDICLYDNMKTVVIERKWTEVSFNKTFTEYANYYWFHPKACPPRKPHHKWKVEKMIWFVRTSFFEWEEFEDLYDLNRKLKHWLDTIWNKKINETTQEVPIDRFNREEKDKLNRFPSKKLEICLTEIRSVYKDCFLSYNGNYYSVPYNYANNFVKVKDYWLYIIIYNDKWEEIAKHNLVLIKGNKRKYIKNKDHFKWIIESRKPKDKIDFIELFNSLGEDWIQFHNWIKNKYPSNTNYQFHQIAKLVDQYSKEDVLNAIIKANKYNAYSCKYIKNIIIDSFNTKLRNTNISIELLNTDPTLITVDKTVINTEVQSRHLSIYEQYA